MVFICFLWFAMLYAGAFMFFKTNDNLSPLKLLPLKYAVLNLPFILFIAFNPNSFLKSVLQACNVNLPEAILQYTIIQSIAFVSLLLGILVFNRKSFQHIAAPVNYLSLYNYKYIRLLAILFFLPGAAGYLFFIYRIGGFVYLFTHLNKRIEMQSGQYYLIFLGFLNFVPLFLILCIKLKNKLTDKVLLVCSLLFICFIFSSFGARKNTLLLLIMVIASYHYSIKKITWHSVNKPFIAAVAVLLSLYILIVPVIRSKDALTKIKDSEVNYEKAFSVKTLLYNVSYTYIDIFAANYYNKDNAWYFDGLLDPVKVFLFKGDKSKAPPVDQGVYFWNVVKNKKDYRPSIPRGQMHKNSWPIENLGFGYANFLLPGVIIAFFLQGLIFSLMYSFLRKEMLNPVLQFMYVFVVFNFNFSNLRLTQLAATLPIALVCYFLFWIVKKHKTPIKLK